MQRGQGRHRCGSTRLRPAARPGRVVALRTPRARLAPQALGTQRSQRRRLGVGSASAPPVSAVRSNANENAGRAGRTWRCTRNGADAHRGPSVRARLGEHADRARRGSGPCPCSAWPPGPVRTGGCSAASTRCCGARRRWRSRAAPSPSGPGRSGTDAASCGWRTAARRRPARSAGPPSTRSTSVSGSAVVAARLRQEQRAPGPAERARCAQVAPPAAPRSARSTARPVPRRVFVVSARTRSVRCAGIHDRRCAASTAPRGAAPRRRPARASTGCGSARRANTSSTSQPLAARSGSTAA